MAIFRKTVYRSKISRVYYGKGSNYKGKKQSNQENPYYSPAKRQRKQKSL